MKKLKMIAEISLCILIAIVILSIPLVGLSLTSVVFFFGVTEDIEGRLRKIPHYRHEPKMLLYCFLVFIYTVAINIYYFN